MRDNHVKVAVTGAAGQIGYALLFRIAAGEMFGPNTTVDLQLLELEASLPALEGVCMELEDCAFPLLRNISTTSDLNEAMDSANWALLVGAVPRKSGMERADLLKVNGAVFTAQGKAINNYAADNVQVLTVGNPCNTNCLITMKNAPDVPQNQFYAMTMLDHYRALSQLAKRAQVPVEAVKKMIIWGNHSSTQFPDFTKATINGDYLTDVITDRKWLENSFIERVQKRGGEIIKARGASSAASAANAIIGSVANIVNETPQDDYYSLAVCSNGEYGVDKDLIFSFPCQTEEGQIKVVEGLEHDEFARERIQTTLDELRTERDTVKDMGLI